MPRKILVQKFGGTSVSTPERRAHLVAHVRAAREAGYEVAIVVSAMGRRGDPYATDTLLDLLRSDGGPVDPADYNMAFVTGEMISVAVVSQTLKRAGIPAAPLSGAQAGLRAEGEPLEAAVTEIDTSRLEHHLSRGEVPVVTGGQAVFPGTLDFATLGRGASDTSGVLVGAALGAERVDIFTDVAAVATADPRLAPGARCVRRVSFARMHEFARFGAKVVHPRAVMAGWKASTPIVVRAVFSDDPGTLIGDVPDEAPILGLAVLSPMETRLIPAGPVSDERRMAWERQRVIMSVRDGATGLLAVGIQQDGAAVLDGTLREAGIKAVAFSSAAAWISVIGDAGALTDTRERFGAALRSAGVIADVEECCGGRTTFVVPALALAPAVAALHAACFEAGAEIA